MRRHSRVAGIACLLAALPASPAWAEARVEARGGLVSVALEAVPADEALAAIRRATGVEIVLPASAQGKTLTLEVRDLPFERFLQRLLEALELGGYLLVYEPGGDARRVIVVDRPRSVPPPAATRPEPSPRKAAPAPAPAARSEPAYIPPATPPVYIPPTTPPVYIPPATPPVYVPPTLPPASSPNP